MLLSRNLLITSLIETKKVASILNFSSVPQEEKIQVRNVYINYVKIGAGPKKLICMPGALGTIWSDFKPQIEGIDREKFTLVAWDPPGYGKSRPPDREFPPNFYDKDADFTYEFMKALKIPKYSLLGWSDGGIVSIIHAAKYPEVVEKLVIWGTNSFILPHELENYKKTRDINTWSQRMRQPMIDIYGEEIFANYWNKWIDSMSIICEKNKGNICNHLLKNVKCPTLILYGEKDPMVDKVHASHLHTHIEGSRLKLYPEGKHNIHLRYAEDFNKNIQEFLLLSNK